MSWRILLGLLGCVACNTTSPQENFRPAPTAERPIGPGPIRDPQTDAGSTQKPGQSQQPTTDSGLEGGVSGGEGEADSGVQVASLCGQRPITNQDFSRKALREAAGRCATWHYCEAEASSTELRKRLEAYADEPGAKTLSHAQAAFAEALRSWSHAELFQFGPAASRAMAAGKDMYNGEGLRDAVYSWPLVARCRVDEQIAAGPTRSQDLMGSAVSGKGLFAIETLLYYEGTDTACSPLSKTATTLASLKPTELSRRKRVYAVAVGRDIQAQLQELNRIWAPTEGDFLSKFADAEGYPSEQEAMNVLAWALIYLEREVKDYKLGIPAGYTLMSPVTVPEASLSELSADALRANLIGFRSLFQGCGEKGEGLGFDDWLTAAGHEDLATDIIQALDDAELALEPLLPLTRANDAEIQAAYASVKRLTDLLKGEFFGGASPLNLELPDSVASDVD